MKKTLATLLTLTLLMGSLATTALAYNLEVVEENAFTITDVYGIRYYSSGTPKYLCEESATITVNKDVIAFHVYYYNYASYTWDEIGLYYTYGYTYGDAPIFDTTEFFITPSDSGVTYSILDYYDGLTDGSIVYSDDFIMPAGNTFTAQAPLTYYIQITYADDSYDECYFGVYSTEDFETMDIDEVLVMEIADDDAQAEEVVEEVEIPTGTAAPTASTVLVDGEEVAFDAYNIADNNYFKLRDIAYILDGTEASFEVTWNEDTQAIDMISGEGYTAVGGELILGDGTAKTYATSTATIYLDGEVVTLEAYTMNDNNYFKLRDLGEALGFNVSWDEDAETIVIASDEAYTAD